MLYIIESLSHIYQETIKNQDFNGSLRINLSGPQLIFLWNTLL